MYRTFFSSDTGGCPFLHISISGATDCEYIEIMFVILDNRF